MIYEPQKCYLLHKMKFVRLRRVGGKIGKQPRSKTISKSIWIWGCANRRWTTSWLCCEAVSLGPKTSLQCLRNYILITWDNDKIRMRAVHNFCAVVLVQVPWVHTIFPPPAAAARFFFDFYNGDKWPRPIYLYIYNIYFLFFCFFIGGGMEKYVLKILLVIFGLFG